MNKYNVGVFDFREELKLSGRLNLVNTSTAHASTVVVHYLLPTYTTFVAVNEWTVLQPTATVTAAGGVDLSVSKEPNIPVRVFSLYLLSKLLQ